MNNLIEHTRMVTPENGPRPAGPADECFYCRTKVGLPHADYCVCRKKVMMVEVTMTIPYVVPSHWEAGDVEFSLNDGSGCADNIVNDLERYMLAKEDTARCMCGDFSGKYVREATGGDLEGLDLVKLVGEY